MIEFTDEQRQNLDGGKAVEIVDAATSRHYVVLGKDVYDRLRHLLYDDATWTDDELRLQLARAAKENIWDVPGMDAYDRYDDEMQQRCP